MTDDPHVAGRGPELSRHLVCRPLGVERQEHNRAFPLGKPRQAQFQPVDIEHRVVCRQRERTVSISRFAQLFPPPLPPFQIDRHRPARAEDERCDLIGVADLIRRAASQSSAASLLHQIEGGILVVQVTKAVEPHARREAPIQLAFRRLGRARGAAGDRARERRRLRRRIVCINAATVPARRRRRSTGRRGPRHRMGAVTQSPLRRR